MRSSKTITALNISDAVLERKTIPESSQLTTDQFGKTEGVRNPSVLNAIEAVTASKGAKITQNILAWKCMAL